MGTVGSGWRPCQLRITSPAALGGVTLRLDDGRSVVGRSRSSQLQISYGDVSRTHAVIDHREGYTTVEDLGSMHGTAVNGISISQVHELHHGDEVRFGSVVAVFEESISPDAPTGRAERSWHAWTSGYWNRITKTTLTAGALAGAIAAIVSVLPSSDPDPQDSARFAAVRLTPLVPLSEYR